jgi:Mlc titration factor MtfA (ptsG expression regulator)
VLVTPEINRHNRHNALRVAGLIGLAGVVAGCLYLPLLSTLVLAPVVYWLIRRRCLRRLGVAQNPFPLEWQAVLERRVRYYRALDDAEQKRFRQMVSVFLDEIRVTGVRTEVDDTVRVLVAASAIIPVFGFADWDYYRLGEVLVYPGSFDEHYRANKLTEPNILGLTGLGYLRGVMILSKPDLLAGFADTPDSENVGIHEFAHLVEQQEVESGLPPEVPLKVVQNWIAYVGRELAHPSHRRNGINDYAYKNEHEFFAVLSEYFFGSPESLRSRNPALYDLLRQLFHQDPARLTSHLRDARTRIRQHDPCPCGSGKLFKACCLHPAVKPEVPG